MGTTYSDFFFLQKLCEEDQKNAGAAASPEAVRAYMLACLQRNEAEPEAMTKSFGTFLVLGSLI